MTKFYMRSLILLGGIFLIQPLGGFAQTRWANQEARKAQGLAQAPQSTNPSTSAAVSTASAGIADSPTLVSSYIRQAMAEINENKSDEAITAANHALEIQYTQETGVEDFRPLAYFALTIAYAQKGDTAKALSQADAGLSRYPGSPVLNYAKGQVLIASGQYSRASEVLLPAFASVTRTIDLKAITAWGYAWDNSDSNLGRTLVVSQYYAGQYPQALESARQLVALHDLGKVCANFKPIPGTEDQCWPIISEHLSSIDGHNVSHFPNNSYADQHLLKGPVGSVAEIYGWSKDHRLQIVREAVPLTKGDADDFALLALALNANGERDQALAMARKAISLDSGSSWAELSYGVALEDSKRLDTLFSSGPVMDDSKRLDEALKALDTPTTPSLNPIMDARRQALQQIHRAVLFARKGDMAKAQELYLAAADQITDTRCLPVAKERDAFLALIQPMVDAHLTKAKQLDAQGKYAESLPEYAQALSFAANWQEAYKLRTAMFAASGKMPTPPEMPDDAHRHIVSGEQMLKDGQIDHALVEFNEALRIAPYMPKMYYNTALIYGELKQYGEAISQMHLYLTAAPEAPDAHTAQDQITKWESQQEIGGNR